MGLFDMFGGGFDKKVEQAVTEVRALGLGVERLRAVVQDKTVTLHGLAKDMDAKRRVMEAISGRVKADNIINQIEIEKPPAPAPVPATAPAAAAEPAAEVTVHQVVSGDTLSGIAKKYYGSGNLYMRIFEANRDILDNPDLIKVGQKLKIPPKE